MLLGLFVCLVAVIGGIRYQEPPDRPREFKFSDLHCWLHPCSIVSAAQYTERRFVSWQYPSGTDWSWDSVEDVELGANDALAVRHSDGRVYQWIDESWYDLGNPLPRDGSSDHVYMAIGSDDSIVISDSSGKVRRSIANRQWETLLASNIVQLWSLNGDIHNGEPLEGHWNSVWSLAFSSDGEHIVSGSSDGTMILWAIGTVHTGMIRRMAGHERAVRSVAFNQDGQRIVSGSSDGTVRLWNTARGEAIGDPLEGHGDGVESVAFDLDGKRIVSGGRDGTVRLWD
ncbi:MAG: hypothetical protein OXQ31_22950, partial [Spirochaetaceae bacterium]|nr:hypothetical protein [Spirochaetaceae bacterium]